MTRREERARVIEIVGREPDNYGHYGRAVSEEGRVYILHSNRCAEMRPDLRECPFSQALDHFGIDLARWPEDQTVTLWFDENRWLVPWW